MRWKYDKTHTNVQKKKKFLFLYLYVFSCCALANCNPIAFDVFNKYLLLLTNPFQTTMQEPGWHILFKTWAEKNNNRHLPSPNSFLKFAACVRAYFDCLITEQFIFIFINSDPKLCIQASTRRLRKRIKKNSHCPYRKFVTAFTTARFVPCLLPKRGGEKDGVRNFAQRNVNGWTNQSLALKDKIFTKIHATVRV